MENQKGKNKRKKKHSKKDMKDIKLSLLLGVFFTILAVIGLFWNHFNYNDYKNSDDVRTVKAEVISVSRSVTRRKLSEEYQNQYEEITEYTVQWEYEVDGKIYKDKDKYRDFFYEGETADIDVYKSFDGKYKVVKIGSIDYLIIQNLLFYFTLGVGLFFLLGSALLYFDPKPLIQPKNKQKK